MRVELRDIQRIYNGKKVVDIAALTLESGKIYAVMGPNGSGKTTLLRIMAGQDICYTGNILYDGAEKANNSCIAYMPQSTYVFDFTVLQNVMLGMGINVSQSRGNKQRNHKIQDIIRRAEQALINVGMDKFSNVSAQSLSGGEAQRVALARTLVLGRGFVLLDEPASAADLSGVELVEKYIKAVNENDRSTIVFTTHNPSQAAHIADEVIMLYNGRILEMGSPLKVLETPRCQETRDFLRNWRI